MNSCSDFFSCFFFCDALPGSCLSVEAGGGSAGGCGPRGSGSPGASPGAMPIERLNSAAPNVARRCEFAGIAVPLMEFVAKAILRPRDPLDKCAELSRERERQTTSSSSDSPPEHLPTGFVI